MILFHVDTNRAGLSIRAESEGVMNSFILVLLLIGSFAGLHSLAMMLYAPRTILAATKKTKVSSSNYNNSYSYKIRNSTARNY